MAQLKVAVDNFNLNAVWTCYFYYHDDGVSGYPRTWQTGGDISKTITFTYELPENSVITGARVHSAWDGSLFGIKTKTINGVEPDEEGYVTVDHANATETSLEVEFYFEAEKDTPSTHPEYETLVEGCESNKTYTLGSHTSSVRVSEVYLLIEYEGGSGYIYHAEDGALVPYQLFHAEDGVLVPYHFQHAEDGALVPYE